MTDKIKLTCPRCKHEWEKALDELENADTIYRLYKDREKETVQRKVQTYRTSCPNDGTYIIVEVEEE